MTTKEVTRTDLYTRVTDQIVSHLEAGVKPWTQPWQSPQGAVSRPLRHNGEPYTGINVLTLWCSSMERGFSAPMWMTFNQALELGGAVRKGEKGSLVVFASSINKTEEGSNGEKQERNIPFLKSYTVFNVEQIDGLPDRYHSKVEIVSNPDQRLADVEAFFAATGATVGYGGDRAYYAPGPDVIQMPTFEAFRDAHGYYATLAHECTHWTSHKSRLDRSFDQQKWGDEGYAREELVAELGAAFLCADLGVALEDRADHASYLASWLKVLKNDKRAIFTAAAHAQRAVEFLKCQKRSL